MTDLEKFIAFSYGVHIDVLKLLQGCLKVGYFYFVSCDGLGILRDSVAVDLDGQSLNAIVFLVYFSLSLVNDPL